MFFTFNQSNPGGSFEFNATGGISRYVIIEAPNKDFAENRAAAIGIYFEGVDHGMDCPCCGDRWYDDPDESDEPTVYGRVVAPGENYPAADEWGSGGLDMKWMGDKPEGFIHYLDGRVEAFWQEVNERQDLNGSNGYGVVFYPTWKEPVVFVVGHNGWDEEGMQSAPSGESSGKRDSLVRRPWVKPDKVTVNVNREYGRIEGWFPTEDEALSFSMLLLSAQKSHEAMLEAWIKDGTKKLKDEFEIDGRLARKILYAWKKPT